MFSTYIVAMVQAFLPNDLLQKIENYSDFYPYFSNG